jgi:hypothetical protein
MDRQQKITFADMREQACVACLSIARTIDAATQSPSAATAGPMK